MSYIVKTFVQGSPSDPAGHTSATLLMQGIGITFTPNATGNVFITISGNLANGTNGDGIDYRGQFGTGTPPVNGATSTGTQFSIISELTKVNGAASNYSFLLSGGLKGLSIGTTYWVDMATKAVPGGNCTVNNLSVTITAV